MTRRISTCLAFVVSSRGRSPWWFDVVVGAILVFAAALARIAILGPASERLAYLTFWPIVLLAAFVGGLPAGLTVVALSAWLVHSAFVPLEDVADWAGLAVFLVAGGFCVGLTELFLRTRAEIFAWEETQSAKAHLAAIVESSIDPILSKGLDGTITSWNSAAARSFGYDAAEILGKPIALLIPPALAAEEAEIVSRLKRGERIKGLETARVAKNGRVVDVSLTISPIRDHDGAISGASTIVRDITAKIQAERDLRASEQRLRLAAETTGVGVWEWNVERNTIIWDAQMFRIYGVTPTPGGVVGYETWAGAVLPEDLPQQEGLLRRHAREGRVNRRQFRIRRRDDGAIRMIEAVETMRANAQGEADCVVGTNLDVSERVQAERALRLSEARLRAAADAARLTYVQFDLENDWVRVAENFGRVTGYAPRTPPQGGALDGARTGLLARVEEPDRPAVFAMFDAIFAGKGGEHRFRVRGDDGVVRWFDSLWRPEHGREGKADRVFATLIDITAAVESQMALEAAKAKADEILASIGDGFCALDAQWRFSYFNRRAETMLGKSCEDVIGRRFFDVFPMVEGTPVHAAYLRVIRDGRPLEFESLSPIMNRWVSFSVYPTRDHGISIYFRDVERRKSAERELIAAKAAAERANVSKSRFLAAASHDLRQPVQTLVLLLALIERQVKENPKAVETARKMTRALGGLNGLLTAILDISRLDAGVVRAAPEAIDLDDLLGRLTAEFGLQAEAKGLRLRVAPTSLHTFADPSLLERALRNLVDNALRYTQEGAVLIGVRRRRGRIRLDVLDTGIGVDEDRRADIFEEFVQVGNPGRDLGRGLGLGLAIVARLAALMGAEIEVDSRVGRGSRFSLYLPRQAAAARTKSVAREVWDAGGRVMIVEDNAILRGSLEGVIQEWGYDTIVAATGDDALERAERAKWRFGAVVSDHRLGAGLTGVELAREMNRRARRVFPTLILTGDTDKQQIAEIMSSGLPMLHKPVAAEALREKLAALLSG